MTAWGFRTKGYQVGVVMLHIFTILLFLGLIAPAWLTYNREIRQIRQEKWFAAVFLGCKYMISWVGSKPFEYTRCGFGFAYAFDDMPDMGNWVHAVEAFEIISIAVLAACCIYLCIINCFSIYPPQRNRIVEFVAMGAGSLAFILTMVFVAKLRAAVERDVFYYFTWGFYLSVVSSIGVVVSSIIITLFNEYIPPPPDNIRGPADYNVNASFSNLSTSSSKPAYRPPQFYGPGGSVSYSVNHDELYDPRIMNTSYDPHPRKHESDI